MNMSLMSSTEIKLFHSGTEKQQRHFMDCIDFDDLHVF